MASKPVSIVMLATAAAFAAACSRSVDLDASTSIDGGLDVGPSDATLDVSTVPPRVLGDRSLVVEIATGAEGQSGWWMSAIGFDRFASPAGCTRRSTGNCTITDCRGAYDGDGGFIAQSSAGVLTAYGDRANDMVQTVPTPDGIYHWGFGYPGPVTGGAVHVIAEGNAIPAFTADVRLPMPLAVTNPRSGDRIDIDRSAGFHVAWSPVDETVMLTLAQGAHRAGGGIGVESLWLQCAFAGRTGEGFVPPDALADFSPVTMPVPEYWLIVQSQSEVMLTAGEFTVTLGVGNGGLFTVPMIR